MWPISWPSDGAGLWHGSALRFQELALIGAGAGFYLNATAEKYSKHYNMCVAAPELG